MYGGLRVPKVGEGPGFWIYDGGGPLVVKLTKPGRP